MSDNPEILAAAAAPESVPTAETEIEAEDAAGKRVVKTLAVGQEVKGVVKRVSEFGAFVDIGVGRDGLVHISELSVRRVGKVTDVLSEGLEVTLWIKKLDRERNRISLTMIPPGTKTVRDLQKDDIVQGTVTRLLPYGAFVDIGVGRDALLHVREMGERFIAKPEDVVKVGELIDAKIVEIQRRRGRIDLSIKGMRPEPEPEPAPEPQPQARDEYRSRDDYRSRDETKPRDDHKSRDDQRSRNEPAPAEPQPGDSFANIEVLSAMELAFKRAMEASGVTLDMGKSTKKQGSKREKHRETQEDIFMRTLKAR